TIRGGVTITGGLGVSRFAAVVVVDPRRVRHGGNYPLGRIRIPCAVFTQFDKTNVFSRQPLSGTLINSSSKLSARSALKHSYGWGGQMKGLKVCMARVVELADTYV